MKTIKIYTDGSCIQSTGVGGWATVSMQETMCGCKTHTTNNEMELLGIYYALILSEDYEKIHIYTDSEYAYMTLTRWAYDWETRGWRKRSSGQIKNLELIQEIFKKVKNNPKVSFHKVKAHSGNKMNERADKLAKKMAYQEY